MADLPFSCMLGPSNLPPLEPYIANSLTACDPPADSVNCPICHDAWNASQNEVVRSRCNHVFHKACVLGRLDVGDLCVLCHRPLFDYWTEHGSIYNMFFTPRVWTVVYRRLEDAMERVGLTKTCPTEAYAGALQDILDHAGSHAAEDMHGLGYSFAAPLWDVYLIQGLYRWVYRRGQDRWDSIGPLCDEARRRFQLVLDEAGGENRE